MMDNRALDATTVVVPPLHPPPPPGNPPFSDPNQSYVRTISEVHVLSCDFDRMVQRVNEDVTAALSDVSQIGTLRQLDDPAACAHIQRVAMTNLNRVMNVFLGVRNLALTAASSRVFMSHQNTQLTNQLRQSAISNAELLNEILQRRKSARETMALVDDLRRRLASVDDTLSNVQQRALDLTSENEQLKRQHSELSKAVSTQSSHCERNEQFFSALVELVANYEVGAPITDAEINSGGTGDVVMSRDTHTCSLCLSHPATVVARPCNHVIACAPCTANLLNQSGASPIVRVSEIVANSCRIFERAPDALTCPRCRTKITDFLYVYV